MPPHPQSRIYKGEKGKAVCFMEAISRKI
uniref:Uncharacterized protein n=1 Tax=Arundo donax TaxID=35708 RepID=A0A0A9E937_ARUDO